MISKREFAFAVSAGLGLALCGLFNGCRARPAVPAVGPAARPVSMVDMETTPAKVVIVNGQHGYVVLDFGTRLVPVLGTQLDVYRGPTRIGAVKITEPVQGRFATADVLTGELRPKDEVR